MFGSMMFTTNVQYKGIQKISFTDRLKLPVAKIIVTCLLLWVMHNTL